MSSLIAAAEEVIDAATWKPSGLPTILGLGACGTAGAVALNSPTEVQIIGMAVSVFVSIAFGFVRCARRIAR